MLSTMRSSWLLFALLALVALSTAFSVEDALNVDGINAYLHHGEKRQAQGTGASSSAAPSTTEEPSSTEDAPSSTAAAPSSTATPTSPAADPSSSEEAPSSSDAAPTSQTERSSAAAATTTDAPAASKSSAKVTTPSFTTKVLVSTEVAPTTTVITFVSNGQTAVQTSVGSRTVEHTTGTTVESSLPTTGASSSGGGGLSSTNKSIIGGVVGGVGGAILLGGIAIVCWRMWGKKKRVTEDDADLMAGTGSALGDKPHSNASPFQSNLEQYHNPGGRPNAAANF
ncbi:uncharacterized protein N0V89_002267 [Didymosphaeria variabile]|uniref:Mid2 domain-containing protein n=1 Tax=Didymosphaeria variabile TaxID=1932322 RepID=A0A9W8XRR4_9PLEO|nr:uncharacterized protein N0V89_002267 [Didymosphaeria variabile]KAJ4357691.1 hypothetical protein N0V89_002267 [Didymosphaeria variabile]